MQYAPRVVAVNISYGGIPKTSVPSARVTRAGLVDDGHDHAKHIRPDRAVSLLDQEILEDLIDEGFPLAPGILGENLTVRGLHVQELLPGTLLEIGTVVLRLEEPRRPCFVLDAIDPRLKSSVVGRCGYMASVVQEGTVCQGASIRQIEPLDRVLSVTTPLGLGLDGFTRGPALPQPDARVVLALPAGRDHSGAST